MRGLLRQAARAGALAALIGTVALLAPGSVAAQGTLPPEPGYEEFEGCPLIGPDESLDIDLCIRISATGELKLGDVEAEIEEPLDLVVGASASVFGDDDPIVRQSEGGAPPDPIRLPGGLLGIPELDPLLDPLDILGIWNVHAAPELGAPEADVTDLLTAGLLLPGGTDLSELGLDPSNLGLPLAINVQNTLFGNQCYIGRPQSPIEIGLTTGTTEPPEGTEPISGGYGVVARGLGDDEEDGLLIGRVVDNRFVDNAFPVPGASRCDPVLGGLLGLNRGLFDSLINSQTGLPAPAGRSSAEFDFGFHIALQESVFGPEGEPSPSPLDFGEVEVGAGASETVTYTNNRPWALELGLGSVSPGSAREVFEIVDDGCANTMLEPGEECEVELRFAPSSVGEHTGAYALNGAGNLPLAGTGASPVGASESELDFGEVEAGQSSPTELIVYENTGGEPVSLDGVVLDGSSPRIPSWEIADGCAGETLPPGGSCEVEVALAPDSDGEKTMTLELHGDDLLHARTELIGSGVYPLTPVESPLEFGEVAVGESSAPQTAVFENTGAEPASIDEIGLGGPSIRHSSWQLDATDCEGRTLASGETCEVEAVLAPDSAGTKNVRLEPEAPNEAELAELSLLGAGVAP